MTVDLKAPFVAALAWEKTHSRKIAGVLGGIAVKSAYSKAFIAFLLSVLAIQSGCASVGAFTPAADASLKRDECVAKALEPLALADAQAAAKALGDGRITLLELFDLGKQAESTEKQVRAAIASCKPQ